MRTRTRHRSARPGPRARLPGRPDRLRAERRRQRGHPRTPRALRPRRGLAPDLHPHRAERGARPRARARSRGTPSRGRRAGGRRARHGPRGCRPRRGYVLAHRRGQVAQALREPDERAERARPPGPACHACVRGDEGAPPRRGTCRARRGGHRRPELRRARPLPRRGDRLPARFPGARHERSTPSRVQPDLGRPARPPCAGGRRLPPPDHLAGRASRPGDAAERTRPLVAGTRAPRRSWPRERGRGRADGGCGAGATPGV